jgi:hypothetical protein
MVGGSLRPLARAQVAAEKMRSLSPALPKVRTLQSGNTIPLQGWRKDLLREANLAPENGRYARFKPQRAGELAPLCASRFSPRAKIRGAALV